MKIKRFIIEYANYKKQLIKNDVYLDDATKERAYKRIDIILLMQKKGLLFNDEAIKLILNSIDYAEKNF